MGLAKGTGWIGAVYRMTMLGDCLLGLGLLLGSGLLGRLRLSAVHTTVRTPRQSTITTRGPLTSHTLARRLLCGGQLLKLEAEVRNFGTELLESSHFWGGFWG